MMTSDGPLFKAYPLNGRVVLSTGEVPTPYHIYDGAGAFFGGTADLGAVRQLLQGEQVRAVETTDGRAWMGVWVCDFTHASLGPHHELQISFFVSWAKLDPMPARPLGLLQAMLTRPDMAMLCHGLWNNTPAAAAYNRELLGLPAQLAESTVWRDARYHIFRFSHPASGTLLAAGRMDIPTKSSLQAGLGLARQLGLSNLLRIRRAPWQNLQVVNPVSESFPTNVPAFTFTKNQKNNLRFYDGGADKFVLRDSRYEGLDFKPQFIQYMQGIQFVYLTPGHVGDGGQHGGGQGVGRTE